MSGGRKLSESELSLWQSCLKDTKPLSKEASNKPAAEETHSVGVETQTNEFLEQFADVKPINYKERAADKHRKPAKISTHKIRHEQIHGAPLESDDFYDSLKRVEPDHVFYDASDRKRLGKPTLSQGRLDLHGMTLEHAFARFKSFIDQASARSCKRVEIVTGIGKTSGGLIRRELPHWIERGDWTVDLELVPNAENLGSVELLLRRKKTP